MTLALSTVSFSERGVAVRIRGSGLYWTAGSCALALATVLANGGAAPVNAENDYTVFTKNAGQQVSVHAGDVLEKGTRMGSTCEFDTPIGVGATMPDSWIGNGPIITVGFDSQCRVLIKKVRVAR